MFDYQNVSSGNNRAATYHNSHYYHDHKWVDLFFSSSRNMQNLYVHIWHFWPHKYFCCLLIKMLAPVTTQPPPTTTSTTTTTSSSTTSEFTSFLIILPLALMTFWVIWNYSFAHDNFSFSNYSAAKEHLWANVLPYSLSDYEHEHGILSNLLSNAPSNIGWQV